MRIGGIHYEFTRDAHLLQQYYALLHKCYSTDLNIHLTELQGTPLEQKEREYNEGGHILVARAGNYVIAGTRLVIALPGDHRPLPMESGFRLRNLFPDYRLDDISYVEIGRLALILDFRGGDIVKNIVRHSLAYVQLHHCTRAFWIAPLKQALYYKRVLTQLKMHSTLHTQLDLPSTHLYRRYENLVIGSCDVRFPDFTYLLLDEPQAVPA
jgi:hypothetical protein